MNFHQSHKVIKITCSLLCIKRFGRGPCHRCAKLPHLMYLNLISYHRLVVSLFFLIASYYICNWLQSLIFVTGRLFGKLWTFKNHFEARSKLLPHSAASLVLMIDRCTLWYQCFCCFFARSTSVLQRKSSLVESTIDIGSCSHFLFLDHWAKIFKLINLLIVSFIKVDGSTYQLPCWLIWKNHTLWVGNHRDQFQKKLGWSMGREI